MNKMNANFEFYNKLKTYMMIKNDPKSIGIFNFHDKIVKRIRNLVLAFYIFILPFLETP